MSVVQPINERIDSWQRSAARLVALGRRARIHGRHDDRLRIETERLLKAVAAEMRKLRDSMHELPEAVATNGRLLDTQRALSSVAAELDRALALLDNEREASRHLDTSLVPEPEYLEIGHDPVNPPLPVLAGR
jgi:hypothetical protein